MCFSLSFIMAGYPSSSEEYSALKRRRYENGQYVPGQVDLAVESVPQSCSLVVFDSKRCTPNAANYMDFTSGPVFRGVFDKASRVLLYRVLFRFDEWMLPPQGCDVRVFQSGGTAPGSYYFTLQRSAVTSAATLVSEFNTKSTAAFGSAYLQLATFTVGGYTYFTLTNSNVGSTMTINGGFVRYGQSAHGLGPGTDPNVYLTVANGTPYVGGRALLIPSRMYYLTSTQLNQLCQAGGTGHTEYTICSSISRSDFDAGISVNPVTTFKMLPGRSVSSLDFQMRDEYGFIVRNGDVDSDGTVLPQAQGYLVVEMVVHQGPF